MSAILLTVTINAASSHVSEGDLDDHLRGIANEISEYARNCRFDDWSRKIQIDYETQEDIDLSISTSIEVAP